MLKSINIETKRGIMTRSSEFRNKQEKKLFVEVLKFVAFVTLVIVIYNIFSDGIL